MARNNRPTAETIKRPETQPNPVAPEETEAAAEAVAENGANNQNTALTDQIDKLGAFILSLDCGYPRATEAYPNGMGATEAAVEYIKELRADVARLKEDHADACALVARMHAAAVGEVTGPNRGVVEDVEEVVNGLKARVAELEAAQVPHTGAGSSQTGEAPNLKDLAVEAYNLFRKSHVEAELPAWAELDPPTQELWRDGFNHVARGGKPRTDYEHTVKYLIASAQ